MTPRRLSDEEIEIWLQVTRTVSPRRSAVAPSPAPPPEPPTSCPSPDPPKPRRPTTASYSPPMSVPKPIQLAAFERRYKKRVEGGRIDIDAALDLHGMRQAEAHSALIRFLLRAHDDDARLVLVVTGKGSSERHRDGGEAGVLRRALPHWLRDRILEGVVLGFEEAGRGHGGAGALYIRLRRRSAER